MAAKFAIFKSRSGDIRFHPKAPPVSSWRPITWFILAVQILFIAWLIVNVISVLDACPNVQGSDVCRTGQAIGTKIGMGIFVFLCVDVLLGGLWVVTNTSTQTCPVCGRDVENELLVCSGCGFDFAAPAGGQDPPAPPGSPA
jgi:hypothetical protein